MPTIHVSVPESVYEELKRRAAEMGVQITDLVRFYIRNGLKSGLIAAEGRAASSREVEELARKFDALRAEVATEIVRIKGKQKELEELFNYVIERIEMLEEMVMKARSARAVDGSVEGLDLD